MDMDGFGSGGSIEEPPNPQDLKQLGANPTGFASLFLFFVYGYLGFLSRSGFA